MKVTKDNHRHGPHKIHECPSSPTGKHCFCVCDSWTTHTDSCTTRTEQCCWCGEHNVERGAQRTTRVPTGLIVSEVSRTARFQSWRSAGRGGQ